MARTSVHMTFVGDKELMRKLGTLGDRVYRKVVAKASRKAFAPVAKTARNLAPKESGTLKKSMGTKQKKYPRAGRIVTIVGPRAGFETTVTVDTPQGPRDVKRDPVKYAHLVEFGTSPHRIGTTEHPGASPQPFMRPAFDSNVHRAESIMRTELAAGVVREGKKPV